jgi:hypothetical protein
MRTHTPQVIGTTYRTRYYFAWSLGHSSLAFAGLDFLKWKDRAAGAAAKGGSSSGSGGSGSSGTTAQQCDAAAGGPGGGTVVGVWGRCRNAQPLKVEFCDSSRLLAGYWNTTTGNFLRRCARARVRVCLRGSLDPYELCVAACLRVHAHVFMCC